MGFHEQSDLLPGRLRGGSTETAEKAGLVLVLLLAVGSVILCVVQGLGNYPEHILMGVVVAGYTAHFLLLCRMYRNDVVQDRRYILFSGALLVVLCTTAVLYSTHWVIPAKRDYYFGCGGPDHYFHPTNATDPFAHSPPGQCLAMRKPVSTIEKCFQLQAAGQGASGALFNGIPLVKNHTIPTSCADARGWIKTCTGKDPLFQCP